jgi:hypothetical protein
VPADFGAEVTAVMATDLGTTQRIPIAWSLGDKADCRHCHTPIEYVEAVTTGLKADAVKLWRHKYTGQAVCADASMGPAEGGFPGHTFAEPSLGG